MLAACRLLFAPDTRLGRGHMRLTRNALLAVALFAGCAPHDVSDEAARTVAADTVADNGDVPVTATTPAIALLAARRPFVHFPTYTPEQRQLVADEAQL